VSFHEEGYTQMQHHLQTTHTNTNSHITAVPPNKTRNDLTTEVLN